MCPHCGEVGIYVAKRLIIVICLQECYLEVHLLGTMYVKYAKLRRPYVMLEETLLKTVGSLESTTTARHYLQVNPASILGEGAANHRAEGS